MVDFRVPEALRQQKTGAFFANACRIILPLIHATLKKVNRNSFILGVEPVYQQL
jgi:hypothetical protein